MERQEAAAERMAALDATCERYGDDAAPGSAEEAGPLRRCLATGEVQPKDGLIRFVIGPDGDVVPDLDERLPGRGLWLSANRAAAERALAKNLFSKAARRAVRATPDLIDRTAALLERRCLDAVGLANRAGQAVAGFEKVREALKTGRVGRAGAPGLLVEAADGSLDQRGKVLALAPGLPVIDLFPSSALAGALGREHAVHAVLARGRLAEGLMRDAARLAGLRGAASSAGRPAADAQAPDGARTNTVHGGQSPEFAAGAGPRGTSH